MPVPKFHIGQKLTVLYCHSELPKQKWGDLTGAVGIVRAMRQTPRDGNYYALDGLKPWLSEKLLAPVNDGPELSNWDEFVRQTGFDPRKAPSHETR